MHTVQLILRPAEYEKAVINKRFHAVSHIHNVCVKHARKLLMRLDHDKEYQSWRSEYCKLLKQKKLSKADRTRRLELSKQMSARRQEIGLSKMGTPVIHKSLWETVQQAHFITAGAGRSCKCMDRC